MDRIKAIINSITLAHVCSRPLRDDYEKTVIQTLSTRRRLRNLMRYRSISMITTAFR